MESMRSAAVTRLSTDQVIRADAVGTVADAIAAAAEPQPAAPARPYLYYNAFVVAKGHAHIRNVVRKQLHDAGFASDTPPVNWEHFGVNADCLVLMTCVAMPDGRTYVHVVASSSTDAPAKYWATELADRVRNDTSVPID